jgi:aspartate/methionine/tyrosine aminotransferase
MISFAPREAKVKPGAPSAGYNKQTDIAAPEPARRPFVMPSVAVSAARVPESRIRELAEIAMRMNGVLKLYFGESNLPTPDFIKKAAMRALEEGFTYYTSNAGLPSLREAIAEYYWRLHRVGLDPERHLVVTASGVQALNLGIRCVLDPGDEALILTPAWPNGSAIVEMCSARPIHIPHLLAHERYTIDFDALERAVSPRTKLLLYTSPSNPLGWVANDQEQHRLLEFARRHGLWLLADEVYERLNYPADGSTTPAPSILRRTNADDAVIVIQSFSKSYCMTGWRLGWIVGRPDLIARARPLNEFVVSHATSFIQKAGEVALLDGDAWVAELHRKLRANRDFCAAALRSMPGVTLPEPEGAFYLFPRIEGVSDSFAFCKQLLMNEKVGVAPGVAFGAGGEGSVRLCYAAEQHILEPALERLGSFLTRNRAAVGA